MINRIINVRITKSPNKLKKFRAEFTNPQTKRTNTIDFGQAGASDYTIHKDKQRMLRYLHRHTNDKDWKNLKEIYFLRSSKEDWNNPTTAGFWSRWLLWSQPSLLSSKRCIEKLFPIRIHFSFKNLY
jgi:hypothetical protein